MTLILRRFVAFIQWCRTPKKTIHAARREKVHPLPPSASQARLRQGARKSRPLTSTERTGLKRSLTEQVKSLSPKDIAERIRRMERTIAERENTSNQVLAKAREEQDQVFSSLSRVRKDYAKLRVEATSARVELLQARDTIRLLQVALHTKSEGVKAARRLAEIAQERCVALEKELNKCRSPEEAQFQRQADAESKRTPEEKLIVFKGRWDLLLMQNWKADPEKPHLRDPRPAAGDVSFLEFPWPTFVTPTLGCPTSGPDSPFSKANIVTFLHALWRHENDSEPMSRHFVRKLISRYHSDQQLRVKPAMYSPHSEAIVAAMHDITCVLNGILRDETA